jgi:hypothetical protein
MGNIIVSLEVFGRNISWKTERLEWTKSPTESLKRLLLAFFFDVFVYFRDLALFACAQLIDGGIFPPIRPKVWAHLAQLETLRLHSQKGYYKKLSMRIESSFTSDLIRKVILLRKIIFYFFTASFRTSDGHSHTTHSFRVKAEWMRCFPY